MSSPPPKRAVQSTIGSFFSSTPSPKRKRELASTNPTGSAPKKSTRTDGVASPRAIAPSPSALSTIRLASSPTTRAPTTSSSRNSTSSPTTRAPSMGSSRDAKRSNHLKKFRAENTKRFFWLDPPLDAAKRPPSHPEYDGRTIYIPEAEFLMMTPFEKQYWEIKRKHFDKVVFFSKGKFYELFEMDADIGVKELGLKMTDRVNMRMVGLPKTHFERWAAKLVHLGYKIVRVDQTETKLERDKRVERRKSAGEAPSPDDNMIGRGVSSIFTPGTLTDEAFIASPYGSYLLVIVEKTSSRDREDTVSPSYGVCFVDASTCEVALGHWVDDREATTLETALVRMKPREIVFERGALSDRTLKMFQVASPQATLSPRMGPSQFWTPRETLSCIERMEYFGPREAGKLDDRSHWPPILCTMSSNVDEHSLAWSAFGGCVSYMQELQLDTRVLPLGKISAYESSSGNATHMVLDGKTLRNLEVFENAHSGGPRGTLFARVNHCVTPFGKRLLRKWVYRPLFAMAHACL